MKPLPILSVLVGFLAIAGCREELGPERFETTQVFGSVTLGGRAIGKGWVEFIPVDGTVGKLRSVPIRQDGSFETDGVAVGRNQIGVVDAPINPGLSHLFHPLSSPIRRTIPSRRTEISIDLLEEAVKDRETRTVTRRP